MTVRMFVVIPRSEGKSLTYRLLRAVNHWRRGDPAPVDVLQALLGAGIDIARLERRYRR